MMVTDIVKGATNIETTIGTIRATRERAIIATETVIAISTEIGTVGETGEILKGYLHTMLVLSKERTFEYIQEVAGYRSTQTIITPPLLSSCPFKSTPAISSISLNVYSSK
jgi:hypothetical protein